MNGRKEAGSSAANDNGCGFNGKLFLGGQR